MIRKLLLIAAIFTLGNVGASQLPDEFYVTERWLSWTTTFDIETKAEKLGTVHRKFFVLTPEYHLHNIEDQLTTKKVENHPILANLQLTCLDFDHPVR